MPKTLPIIDTTTPVCCEPVSAAPMDEHAALEVAVRLKALADPMRIRLMSLLLTDTAGAMCTCDLAGALELAESTVSHHLGQLRRAGMVASERRGMNVYYSARPEALDALRAVLDPACCR
ncbi:transcriptional regulator, ArsR family [Rhodococcoides kroppenstedtii]|uniref:Transcriptional regulator, ArsR family n=1 Tax=Rhodococcoides kroppenstedtii TaxID=293050 RepID=A0A1I0TP48_9NOCA|nr:MULTISPECIES: Rv2640c family ArsR-like transcriptional regulator [Rhodococcus]MBT1191202.1 winged helix-turn-helix transcriptional regulator [Rhodococcus kroppenstedtii]MBY6361613.1 winged helix-turn-helix transcriptional regulator [Rhodococcus corynebacterioides]SFA53537.1 transcriptional regulator, ArsR family [Rhodococcus kroppenstedtii]